MSWDISNRQILVETVRAVALWVAICIPLFLLTLWVTHFFPSLQPWRSGIIGGLCGPAAVLVQRLILYHRKRGRRF